jgi:predicted RNA-binding Zn-ribbon protein involved in translation (DUF1610 family)
MGINLGGGCMSHVKPPRCDKCGAKTERVVTYDERHVFNCPKCGKDVVIIKLFSDSKTVRL